MNILLVGNPNSIFIYNYIKNVLCKADYRISLLSFEINQKIKSEYNEFYKKSDITIIVRPEIGNIVKRIPKIRGYINSYLCHRTIKELFQNEKYFDIIHFQFVITQNLYIIKKYSKQYGKIISTFWGSDLLRTKIKDSKKIKEIIDKSTAITVATEFMKETLCQNYGFRFEFKVHLARFGLSALDEIKKVNAEETLDDSKKHLNIPVDKIIIVCGYNAYRAQQHKLIINSLKQCSSEIIDKIFVVLPLAYPEDSEYINEINNYFKNSSIHYMLNTDFLDDINVSRLRLSCDIFIHAQIDDAFSGSMQEHIFANNIVLNGIWLKYPILLNNGIYYRSFSNEMDLTSIITDTIVNIQKEKDNAKQNSAKIYEISSWEKVKDQWTILYKNN